MEATTILPTTFNVTFDNYSKQYPIVSAPANKKLGIVYLYDLNDNFQLATQIAKQLSLQIYASGLLSQAEVLAMPGDCANMLGTLLFQNLLNYQSNLKFCIVRASPKGGSYKSVAYQSLTSVASKTLHLRKDQFDAVASKNIIIFDDVISTGATLTAMMQLMSLSQAKVQAFACFATEGEPIHAFHHKPLFKLTHLPVVAYTQL